MQSASRLAAGSRLAAPALLALRKVAEPPAPVRRAIWSRLDRIVHAGPSMPVDYANPPGDLGLFGPDSAVWYVHSHLSMLLGGMAVLLVQALEPGMAAASSRSSFGTEPAERLSRSGAFVIGMTYGSTETTQRFARMVRAMHERVSGVTAHGYRYSANDPESQRFAAAIFPLGLLAAHRRYHPRSLRGADIDRFVAEWAVISASVGPASVPTTYAETLEYVQSVVPRLVAPRYPYSGGPVEYDRTINAWELVELWIMASPLPGPAARSVLWGLADLLPRWARDLYGVPSPSPAQTVMTRASLYSAFNVLQYASGVPDEVVQARRRVATC